MILVEDSFEKLPALRRRICIFSLACQTEKPGGGRVYIDVMLGRYPGERHLLRIVTAESAARGDVRYNPIDQVLGVDQEGFLLRCLVQCQKRQGCPSDVACRGAI